MSEIINKKNIDESINEYFEEYSFEVNTNRMIPFIVDGFIPVQRRIVKVIYDLTKNNKLVKSARAVGDILGKYHPHGDGSIYSAIVKMVNSPFKLIIGKGNWGNENTIIPCAAAASRYTEVKFNPTMKSYMSLYSYAKLKPSEIGDGYEPQEIPVLFPYALLHGRNGIGAGKGARVIIPPYKYNDLMNRLLGLLKLKDLKTIKPYYGYNLNMDGEFDKILTTGKGTIKLMPDITYDKTKNLYTLYGVSPFINLKSKLDKIIDNLNAEVKDGASKGKRNIFIKVRKNSKYNTKEKIEEYLINTLSGNLVAYDIKVCTDKDFFSISVDEWLMICYNNIKYYYLKMITEKINSLKYKIKINNYLLNLRPILESYIKANKFNWNEFITKHMKPLCVKLYNKVDDDIISNVSSASIKKIIQVKDEIAEYQKEISILNVKVDKNNVEHYTLLEMYGYDTKQK